MNKPRRDWDDAFANMAHVPGSDELPTRWARLARDYRNSGVEQETDIAYGRHPRERMDVFWPDSTARGLAIFVHGGYWMRLDKSYWSHLAEGARASGWAVCLPSYTLAPEARIHEMTRQIGLAISTAAQRVDGPIRLAGHSAGGHLVSRMACDDSPLQSHTRQRVAHVLSISGIHDLRPLRWTQMNQTLKLDEGEACRESSALLRPMDAACITAWVGGGERPEFLRQARLLDIMWSGLDARTRCVVDGDFNHFTVVDGLMQADSAITQAFVNAERSLPRSN